VEEPLSEQDLASVIADFVGRRRWAVVGASENPDKYGHKVFSVLLQSGYQVYGVNPKGGTLLGHKLYPSLAALPEKPEVVNTVVPPPVTEQIAKEVVALGIKRVWMQPGSESQAAIEYLQEHGVQVVHGACAMVHRRRHWPNTDPDASNRT
jgi:predicted CoA-binding protein